MAQPYPLPRQSRQSDIVVGDGRAPATYGPFSFKVFDAVDVVVETSVDGGAWTPETVTVTKADPAPGAFSFFTVTFATVIEGDVRFVVSSRRLHERSTDITQNGRIDADKWEKELSKQGSVLQDTRRDLDRTFRLAYGHDAANATIEPGEDDTTLVWKDGRLVEGPSAGDVAGAQGFATEAKQARDQAVPAAAAAVQAADQAVPAAASAIAARDVTTAARDETVAARDQAVPAAATALDAAERAETAADGLDDVIAVVESIDVKANEPVPSIYRFDAVDGQPLPGGMNFARASGGYALNRQGRLQWYGVNAPRHAYKPNGEYRGVLVEGASTNRFLYSAEIDNAAWSKIRSSVAANVALAPDGTMTADKLIANTENNTHNVQQSVSYTAGVTETISRFVKAAEYSQCALQIGGTAFSNGTMRRVIFDMAAKTGTVDAGTPNSYGIDDIGDGWFRVWMTVTIEVTNSVVSILFVANGGSTTFAGDGTSGILVWGAQVEPLGHASSYIPTAGAAASRSADDWGAPVAALGGWSNNPYTMYADADIEGLNGARNAIVSLRGSSASRGASLQTQNPGGGDVNIGLRHRGDAAQTDLFILSAFTAGRRLVTAGSFDGSTLAAATGGASATPASLSAGDTFTALEMKIGRDTVAGGGDTNYLFGCIRTIVLWDRALSTAQLSVLTTRSVGDTQNAFARKFSIMEQNTFLADISLQNTAAQNATLLALVAAEAFKQKGNDAVVSVMPGLFDTVGNLGGIRKLKGLGSGIMDFSGRGTASGSLVTAAGSSTGEYPLNLNAARLSTSLRVTNANAAALGLFPGKWLRVVSDAVEAAGAPETLASLGEWVQVEATEVVSGNTIIHVNRPLVFAYTTALNARILGDSTIRAFAYEDLEILGTGNQHVTVGNLTSGDNGMAIQLCELAEWNNVRVHNSERNSLRSSINVFGRAQDCRTYHSRPHNNAQIQYGLAASGACREFQTINLRGSRGRHLLDYSGTPGGGAFERAVEERCVAEDTYSDGFAEHNSLLERISMDCTAKFCGDGWHYRGRGVRRNVNPTVISTIQVTPVTGGGADAAGPDAAFVLSRFAGDVEVIGMKVRDVGYVLRAQHEGSTQNFNYIGDAPERIKFTGGDAREITRGFLVDHRGGQAGGPYNTKATGPYHIVGVDLEMSPRQGDTVSVNPLFFSGYVNRVILEDISVEYPAGVAPGYAALFYGVAEAIVEGLTAKRTQGIVHTSRDVFNGAGATVARQPGILDIRSAPTLLDHQNDRLVLFGGTGFEYRAPPPSQLFVGSTNANHTGTTAETTLLSIPVNGGRMGPNGSLLIDDLIFIGNAGSNRTYRVKVNGTTIWSLTTSNTGVRVPPLHLVNQNNVASQALFTGLEGAGSSANLATFAIATGGNFNIDITCQLTASGDTARVRSARAMLHQR